jgi:predicted small integral membrane protein
MKEQLRIGIFTIVEGLTLVTWLALVRSEAGIYQVSTGSLVAGLALLVVGITIEHIIAYNVIHNRGLLDLQGVPIGQKFVVSLIETAIWALWLVLVRINAIVAAVVLTGLLILEHTLSDNVFKGKDIFSKLLDARTIGFSLVEAVGAAIWLALVLANLTIVGVLILVVASFIEHTMAVTLARQQPIA